MKILVTGGLGFIGTNFIWHTLSKSPEKAIINLDKIGLGANPSNLKDIMNEKNYRFIQGDISDQKTVHKLVEKVNAIINFAAETHVDRSIADPEPFIKSNVIGTFSLLEAVRNVNNDCKYIQVSTDEIYGDILEGSFCETDGLNPSNPYSATKASADMLCLAYHRTYGLDLNITRCTNNYGPYQFPEKLIPKTIIRALKNLPIPVYGTGTNMRDWIYGLDHCEAMLLVLDKGRPGEIYNISSGNEIQNIQIVQKILKFLRKPEDLIMFVEDRPGHDLRYSLDSSKLRRELSWKPKHTFQSSLEETVKWYVKNESWWKLLTTDKILSPTPWKLG